MKKILLLLTLAFIAVQNLSAQVTSITVEPFYTDDGTVDGYPSGHTTYRIYANLTHATDRLTTIYGEDESPLFINVGGNGIWNASEGGNTAYSINCNLLEVLPYLAFDSYLALGYTCNSGDIDEVQVVEDPNIATWIEESFNTAPYGQNEVVVNSNAGAAWFGMTDHANTIAGDEMRILIAQVTTNGDLCGTLNFQVFPEYSGVGSEYIEQTGFAFNSASSGDIVITTDVVPPSCFGDENASIEVSAEGGTGTLTYSFDNITYGDITILNDIGAGTYEVFVQDEAGCVAVESIEIVDPQAIFATAEVSDITCHDASDGAIHINHEGGTGILVFSIDGENFLPSPDFENLNEGTYNIHVVDINNCSFHSDEDIVLTSPEAIEATIEVEFITCFGASDGEILISATGGLAPYEFNIGEGYSIENPITGVDFGSYDVLLRDALGCVYTIPEQALVAEPTALSVAGLEAIDILDGVPGGNTEYTVEGGVFPYTFVWTDEEGNVVSNTENLPQLFGQSAAGSYTLTITDDVGCVLIIPLVISYTVNIDELNSSLAVELYPNPTSGIFTLNIKSTESKTLTYQITDAAGRLVRSSQLITTGISYQEQVDVTSLSQGIYFLETKSDNVSKTIRLIKL